MIDKDNKFVQTDLAFLITGSRGDFKDNQDAELINKPFIISTLDTDTMTIDPHESKRDDIETQNQLLQQR